MEAFEEGTKAAYLEDEAEQIKTISKFFEKEVKQEEKMQKIREMKNGKQFEILIMFICISPSSNI